MYCVDVAIGGKLSRGTAFDSVGDERVLWLLCLKIGLLVVDILGFREDGNNSRIE